MAHTRQDVIYRGTFSNHCRLKKYFTIILHNRQKMKQYFDSLHSDINSRHI